VQKITVGTFVDSGQLESGTRARGDSFIKDPR
jgi:hypothetical protein